METNVQHEMTIIFIQTNLMSSISINMSGQRVEFERFFYVTAI